MSRRAETGRVSPLRILQIHCEYTSHGGEEHLAMQEARMLREAGHEVYEWRTRNQEHVSSQRLQTLYNLATAPWNPSSYMSIGKLLKHQRFDIIHGHNFWFALSPSYLDAAREAGIPVVMSLHNFRLHCAGGTYARKGEICELCLTESPWKSVLRKCYRNSALQTALLVGTNELHKRLNTWETKVDAFLCLSEFGRRKFIEGGLPADKLFIKHNFVANRPHVSPKMGRGALFVGRLTREKGVHLLQQAWESMTSPLTLVGEGELRREQAVSYGENGIHYTGQLSQEQVIPYYDNAAFTVLPATCYEGYPLVVLESFRSGRPVIVSRIGPLPDIVEEGVTGLHFNNNDPKDLEEKVRFLIDNPELCQQMGERARKEFEEKYSDKHNLPRLLEVYHHCLSNRTTSKAR